MGDLPLTRVCPSCSVRYMAFVAPEPYYCHTCARKRDEQTSIPVPDAEPEPHNCAWCSAPATDVLEVEPRRLVPVCAHHLETLTTDGGR